MVSDEQITSLKNYFQNRPDIAFAFLFGSQARGTATKLSDVDIAVYFYPKERRPIEYEKEIFYDTEGEVWSDVERLVKREAEVLVLNRAPASFAASALRGIPLAINDWGLYLEFMEVVTAEAEDFMDMVIENYRERLALEKRD